MWRSRPIGEIFHGSRRERARRGVGTRALALVHAGSHELAEHKRRFLDASNADRKGGSHSTGVRWWIVFCVYGRGISPVPDPRDSSRAARLAAEDTLEDYAVWLAVFAPSGRQISHKSVGKYCSSVRAWYKRFYRAQLGLGARDGRIPDILKGYARLVDQPPPLERHGCAPAALARGMRVAFGGEDGESVMWRAALAFGFGSMSRGVEFALDADRGEEFEESEHMVPADVRGFARGGVRHARVRMRKRKDLTVLRGKHAEVVLGGGGAAFDAVLLLEEWLAKRRELGIGEGRPLFCHLNGKGITVREVRAAVRAAMEAAGLDPRLFGAHSLRIGAATAALAAGVPPSLIRLMGRWASDVYEIYCRMSLEAALGVGRAMASATVTTFEGGFKEEHLELQPSEVAALREAAGDELDSDGEED